MFDVHGKSIVSVKHTYFESAGTPEAELIRYLRGKASSILYVRHPFPDAVQIPLNTTVVEYDSDGKIIHEITATSIPPKECNALLFYIKDLIFSIYYVIRSGRKYDLYIGSDNLNTLAGLILRKIGRVRRVVYYVIDFSPVRFPGRFLNAVYQYINKLCCYHADVIWNVSEAMIAGRENIGIQKEKSAPQITVPLGCMFDSIHRKPLSEIDRFSIVYFGALRPEHGPGLILEALPEILKVYPEANVVFAGGGELKNSLENRAETLGITDNVRFTGFLATDEDVYNVLIGCGLALATYPADDTTYKKYCDPGKVKIYLACGLPVLITDVPAVAREIKEKGAGVIVEHDPVKLAETVCGIFADEERYEHMRKRAVDMAAEYQWETIWERTFAKI
ncbi:MAG: glycosyltransferase [Candidatus Latescibacteria bacterium]|nr:glycosyltransferase [Candidatus Latescibacterota bacterium]